MNAFVHQTVLRREATDLLAPAAGKVIVDCTLGGGGHAEALLAAGARVVGLDRDPRALQAAKERLAESAGQALTLVHADFREARAVLTGLGLPEVDGALVDLGVSSPQLDDAGRGF